MAPAPSITVPTGPWRRVVDTARAGQPSPDALRDLQDAVLLPDGSAVARPGFRVLAAHPGAPGAAQGVWSGDLAGTVWTVAVVGGVLAAYDWDTDTWATLAHAGTTINATGRVALTSFFDQLVVSDGVNRPWRTTPGSGVGTYLGCATGPWYGIPETKDAKLLGIKADERRTIVWSEEADLTIGGEVGGYNNAWDLRQTSQGALVALSATNSALAYLRERSVGQITGSVNDDFQGSGTHDSVAQTSGTLSPFAVVRTDEGTLWTVDALGQPYRVSPGPGVEPLWLACQATIATVDRTRLAAAWGLYVPDLDAVAFALPRTPGDLHNTDLLWFDRASGDYAGRWTPPGGLTDFAVGGLVTDSAGIARLVVFDRDGTAAVCARQQEADADASAAVDLAGSGAATIPPARVVLADAASDADQAVWVQWTTAVLEAGDPRQGSVPPVLVPGATGATAITYACETPGHAMDAAPRAVVVGADGKKTIGLQRWGRWLRMAIAAAPPIDAAGARFRLRRVTLVGTPRDVAPGRR